MFWGALGLTSQVTDARNEWFWWPMISGDGWGLSFLDICLTVEKKPGKILNQGNWPDRGSNLGPLGERQRCYPLTTALVRIRKKVLNWKVSVLLYLSSVYSDVSNTVQFCQVPLLILYLNEYWTAYKCAYVDRGGPVVMILASGSEVRGFDPGRSR